VRKEEGGTHTYIYTYIYIYIYIYIHTYIYTYIYTHTHTHIYVYIYIYIYIYNGTYYTHRYLTDTHRHTETDTHKQTHTRDEQQGGLSAQKQTTTTTPGAQGPKLQTIHTCKNKRVLSGGPMRKRMSRQPKATTGNTTAVRVSPDAAHQGRSDLCLGQVCVGWGTAANVSTVDISMCIHAHQKR
jgi:hypothetical protein